MALVGKQRQAWGQSRSNDGASHCLPMWPLLFFLVGVIGLGVWCGYFRSAFNKTNHVLDSLQMTNEWKRDVNVGGWVLTIAYAAILLASVLLSYWKSVLAKRVDNEGRASRTSMGYIMFTSISITVWWLLLALVLMVFLATAVWGTTMLRLRDDAYYSLKRGGQYSQLPAGQRGDVLGTTPIVDGGYCPGRCMDLQKFGDVVNSNKCVCDTNTLESVETSAGDAQGRLWRSAIGLALMMGAGSWMMLSLTGHLAYARTQRTLYLRGAAPADESALPPPSPGATPAAEPPGKPNMTVSNV